MVIIDGFLWIIGGFFFFTMVYLCFLAIVSLLPPRKETVDDHIPLTRFAVIIPAHDEAKVIKETLNSLQQLDYPDALCSLIVIADNCSDNTASIAADCGVRCLQRHNHQLRGKGFALQWAVEQFKRNGTFHNYDAFVIIDADTIAAPDFLGALDKRIRQGAEVIQGYYDVINPEVSPMASLSYLGFVISRNLRFKGRTYLGWSNNLLGNGMSFSRKVIDRFGWPATSIVEDIEFAVILHLSGIRVTFAPEAKIYAVIPDTFEGSKIQRSRWDIGKFKIRNKYIRKLIARLIKSRDISYLDTIMELIIPPFSLFVLGATFAFLIFLLAGFPGFTSSAWLWLINMAALALYVMLGLSMAQANWKIYRNLVYAPFFVIWRVKTIIWGYFLQVGENWIKTER